MEPFSALLSFCKAQIVTQGFAAGIVGNLLASAGYDLGKSGINNLGRRLGEVWQQGGRFRNHDLMRALLFAESQAAVAVCEICLLEDYKTQPTLWRAFLVDRDAELHLFGNDVRLIARVRARFYAQARRVEKLDEPELEALLAATVDDVRDLVAAGNELQGADAPGELTTLQARASEQAVALLTVALQEGAGQPGWRKLVNRIFDRQAAQTEIPAPLRARFEQHWFDLLRAAFREALKDDRFSKARRAFELDVLSGLPNDLPRRFEELDLRLGRLDERLDAMVGLLGEMRERMKQGDVEASVAWARAHFDAAFGSWQEEVRTRFDRLQASADRIESKVEAVPDAVVARLRAEMLAPAIAGPELPPPAPVPFLGRDTELRALLAALGFTSETDQPQRTQSSAEAAEPAGLGPDSSSEASSSEASASSAVNLFSSADSAVNQHSSTAVLVLGSAGMGKTTLTVKAFHEPALAARFGVRRFFVRCEVAAGCAALVQQIGRQLELGAQSYDPQAVRNALALAPALLVLDNLETPWLAEMQAVEELVGALSETQGLALLASLRGDDPPGGIAWDALIKPDPFDLETARRVFLHTARNCAGPPNRPDELDALLTEMDGVPLAVTLLAHAGQQEGDLARLARRWRDERTALLARGAADHRNLSWQASLRLSLEAAPMRQSPEPLRLLATLALLPAGMAGEDLEALFPQTGWRAAATLRNLALAALVDRRLRMLNPVREFVREAYPLSPDDLKRTTQHYMALSELGERVGKHGGAEAIARLTPEITNVGEVLKREAEIKLAKSDWKITDELIEDARRTNQVALNIAKFFLETATPETLSQPVSMSPALVRQVTALSDSTFRLGTNALESSQYEKARGYYEQAHSLYEQVGLPAGQADCIRSLGDIELECSQYKQARLYYELAQSLFEQGGSLFGQAYCIQSLGDIDLKENEPGHARKKFEAALELYGRIPEPYLIGEAHTRLARLAEGEERTRQVAAARGAWLSIDRPDLVAALDDEFGRE